MLTTRPPKPLSTNALAQTSRNKQISTFLAAEPEVYGNEKENWRILNNKEIYTIVKKPTITETIRLHKLCWFGHVQRMQENRIPKRV
jgi:hypothetical protein